MFESTDVGQALLNLELDLGLTLWRALKLDKLLQRCIPRNREGIPWSVVARVGELHLVISGIKTQ